MPQSASAQAPTAPPEVEATLTRLTAHKNVQGVLILSRPLGHILRSAGSLFALPASAAGRASASTPAVGDEDAEGDEQKEAEKEEEEKGVVRNSELALRYAKAAVGMVEAVGGEIAGLGGRGEGETQDDLRFLRIRTRRHELMITPDEQYILIVVQDPTH